MVFLKNNLFSFRITGTKITQEHLHTFNKWLVLKDVFPSEELGGGDGGLGQFQHKILL